MNKLYKKLQNSLNIILFMLIAPFAISEQFAYVANSQVNTISSYEITYGVNPLLQTQLGYTPYLIRANQSNLYVVSEDLYNISKSKLFIYNNIFAKNGLASLVEASESPVKIKDIQFYNGLVYIISAAGIYIYLGAERFSHVPIEVGAQIISVSFADNNMVFVQTTSGLKQYLVNSDGKFLPIKIIITSIHNDDYTPVVADKPNANYLYRLEKTRLNILSSKYNYSTLQLSNIPYSQNKTARDLISVSSGNASYVYIAFNNNLPNVDDLYSSIIIYKLNQDDSSITYIQEIKFKNPITDISISNDGLYFYVLVDGENKIYQYNRDIFTGKLIPIAWSNTGYGPVSMAITPQF